tara:strand:- start:273 stop:680 length:408 start_codon:yes stop_codon:yes gene_type:complete
MLSTSKGSVIKITDNAWKRMSNVIKDRRARGFIFSAESGGCNGFNYKLTLFKDLYEIENMENTQKTSLKATKIENNGVEVYIDPLSEMFLLGSTIDFISEDFSKNIFENRFTFEPDKTLATTCGCGISFNPKAIN